jgi:hypothetical protein
MVLGGTTKIPISVHLFKHRRRPAWSADPMHSPLASMHLHNGAAHLHALGDRALADFLAELAGRIGGMPAIVGLLNEYRARPTPPTIAATGAERTMRRVSVLSGGAR